MGVLCEWRCSGKDRNRNWWTSVVLLASSHSLPPASRSARCNGDWVCRATPRSRALLPTSAHGRGDRGLPIGGGRRPASPPLPDRYIGEATGPAAPVRRRTVQPVGLATKPQPSVWPGSPPEAPRLFRYARPHAGAAAPPRRHCVRTRPSCQDRRRPSVAYRTLQPRTAPSRCRLDSANLMNVPRLRSGPWIGGRTPGSREYRLQRRQLTNRTDGTCKPPLRNQPANHRLDAIVLKNKEGIH